MITLTDGTATVSLPDDLDWTDELSWSPVKQSADPSITGATIVQIQARQSGRPITLEGTDTRYVSGAGVAQLHAWSQTPGQQLTLTLRGVARPVIFRHHDAPAFTAREIFGRVPTLDAAQFYEITLKLMET